MLVHAAAVAAADGAVFSPGAVAVRGGEAIGRGEAGDLRRAWAGAREVDLGERFGPVLALPGMVNAHAHLDLASVGPRPYGGSFLDWVRGEVLPARRLGERAIAAAVRAAAAASLDAGVEVVGDVAGAAGSRAALAASGLRGVSFEEVFGLRPDAVGRLRERVAEVAAEPEAGGVAPGLQPHAPYSVSPDGYAACVATGLPLSTHLAELAEEAELVGTGSGPMRAMLEKTGLWGEELEAFYGGGTGPGGAGSSPVAWLRPHLEAAAGRFVVAHANHVDDDDLATLAATRTSVAFCPVASAYFGHRGHRYREMLDAGVTVAFGTDSVLCQPADEPQPHGVSAQARLLFRRDAADPATLVRMATANGFAALGLPPRTRRLALVPVDPSADDPLRQALGNDAAVRGVLLEDLHQTIEPRHRAG